MGTSQCLSQSAADAVRESAATDWCCVMDCTCSFTQLRSGGKQTLYLESLFSFPFKWPFSRSHTQTHKQRTGRFEPVQRGRRRLGRTIGVGNQTGNGMMLVRVWALMLHKKRRREITRCGRFKLTLRGERKKKVNQRFKRVIFPPWSGSEPFSYETRREKEMSYIRVSFSSFISTPSSKLEEIRREEKRRERRVRACGSCWIYFGSALQVGGGLAKEDIFIYCSHMHRRWWWCLDGVGEKEKFSISRARPSERGAGWWQMFFFISIE